MVSFKICLRNVNKNGFWPVYIRVTNNRRIGYIKTKWVVDKRGIGKNGQVKDPFVLENCSKKITEYIRRVNGIDTTEWDIGRIRSFLEGKEGNITFSAYARSYISRLEKLGHDGNARLYKASLRSFERHMQTTTIAFGDVSKGSIESWIAELGHTSRAKSLYPICIRVIFHDAMAASTDPSSILPRLTYDPWNNVAIPESTPARKRSIGVSECRRFFDVDIPDGKDSWVERLGRDMTLLSFALAGINTVDLFALTKDNFDGSIIRYNRTKTQNRRKDGAYFEIRVNETAATIIEKYRAHDDNKWLFGFSGRYNGARSFNTIVNKGIARICTDRLGMNADQVYTFYSFRHTWATIAQNICGATLSEIGFAMNHIDDNAVTRGYIDIDFSPAWELNQKVFEVVFGSTEIQPEVKMSQKGDQGNNLVRPDCMIYARLYCRGDLLGEISDIGFASVDDVIARLSTTGVPGGAAMQFRIKNVDTGQEAVIERINGKLKR